MMLKMNSDASAGTETDTTAVTLYDYWRSTASYRVRIALALAGINWRTISVDLVRGDQQQAEHIGRNPQGLVPVLDIDGHRFTQSLAIIEYLDTTRELGLLPAQPVARAHVQALAASLAIDVHPVCNLSVVSHATGGKEPARTQWMQQFITPGLNAFEKLLAGFEQNPYCTGNSLSLADLCLVPQLYNADRWGVDYANCRRIVAIAEACTEHTAFVQAHPDAARVD